MKKIGILLGIACIFGGLACHAGPNHPNLVFILADDLGYGDLGCYGRTDIRTPQLDRLARQGVRLTCHYANGPECSPTRAAFLTGRYQQRLGGLECAIGTGNVGRYDDAVRLRETNDLGLPAEEPTIANSLKRAGYATAIFGKWHLGYEPKFAPQHHGFEQTFYCIGGGMDYFHYLDTSAGYNLFRDGQPVSANGYFTDLMTNEAIDFLKKHDASRPFFLYLPYTCPHSPFQGPQDRREHPLPLDSPLWNQGTAPQQTYRDMIEHMDKRIGDVLSILDEGGYSENTVVVFASDNGGTRSARNAPLSGSKGSTYEGGIRVPAIIRWPGRIAPGTANDEPSITFDFTRSFAELADVPRNTQKPLEGIKLIQLLSNREPLPTRTLFWRKQRGVRVWKAVREGHSKYVASATPNEEHEFLYDLSTDIGEKEDLANSQPTELARLRGKYLAWEAEVRRGRRGQPRANGDRGSGSDRGVSMAESPTIDQGYSNSPQPREMNRVASPPGGHALAIVGGTIIDGHGGTPLEDAVVVIRGNRIVAVGRRGDVIMPTGCRQVDATGKSVLPGLFDSHFHSRDSVERPIEFELQNGITSFRDPGHPFKYYDKLLSTDETIPRVFLCGGHLDSEPVVWPDQAQRIGTRDAAVAAVNEHVRRGASAIKVYFRLPLDCIEAACDAAANHGVPVTAHLELVDADKAILAGIRGVEHITSFGSVIAPQEIAQQTKAMIHADSDARRQWRYRLWASVSLEDNPKVDELLKLIVSRQVFVSPTLAIFESRVDENNEDSRMRTAAFANMLGFFRRCHEAGAPVVVGSHTSAPFARQGKAYLREMQLMVEAGMTPLDVITAATKTNAKFFGVEHRLGTIEPGKLADLIIVHGNPATSIDDIDRIDRVLLNGQVVSRREVDSR